MAKGTCSIEGCDRGAVCRGWCNSHYERVRKHGDPLVDVPLPRRAPKERCSVEGCERSGKLARGWCAMHYSRWLSSGDPLVVRSRYDEYERSGCSVEGCARDVLAKDLCGKHYQRWKNHGDPLVVLPASSPPRKPVVPAEERFWSKVDRSGGPDACWLWTASLNGHGYGQFYLRDLAGRRKKLVRAHRFAYEAMVGPIPEGLHLDHVRARGCVNRNCVNPAHLEPVTPAENIRRAMLEECVNGHPYTPENLYLYRDKRMCRECRREAQRKSAGRGRAIP